MRAQVFFWSEAHEVRPTGAPSGAQLHHAALKTIPAEIRDGEGVRFAARVLLIHLCHKMQNLFEHDEREHDRLEVGPAAGLGLRPGQVAPYITLPDGLQQPAPVCTKC